MKEAALFCVASRAVADRSGPPPDGWPSVPRGIPRPWALALVAAREVIAHSGRGIPTAERQAGAIATVTDPGSTYGEYRDACFEFAPIVAGLMERNILWPPPPPGWPEPRGDEMAAWALLGLERMSRGYDPSRHGDDPWAYARFFMGHTTGVLPDTHWRELVWNGITRDRLLRDRYHAEIEDATWDASHRATPPPTPTP